jgi:3-oxoadipate enol-lactonase
MPFTSVDGRTVHYDITGPADAPPVAFANSLGTNFHLWDPQLPALASWYRVIRYDMRGHGLSASGSRREYTIAELADDLAGLLDALDVERASVVGLSIGGVVAQRFAAEYPARIERLVLCATGNRIGTVATWTERMETAEREGMAPLVEATLGRWFTPRMHVERPVEVDGFRQMLSRTPVAGYVGCCAALRDADLNADDARIAAPTRVIAGSEDVVTTPEMGAALRDAIPGAELAVIPGAKHLLNVECPDEVAGLVQAFLEMRTPAEAGG